MNVDGKVFMVMLFLQKQINAYKGINCSLFFMKVQTTSFDMKETSGFLYAVTRLKNNAVRYWWHADKCWRRYKRGRDKVSSLYENIFSAMFIFKLNFIARWVRDKA